MLLKKLTAILYISLAFAAAAVGVSGQAEESQNRYLDRDGGLTADQAVEKALANNGELLAVRGEVAAARSMIIQARLRPNPKIDLSGTAPIGGMDNSQAIGVTLPLELGGRRSARIAVAEREFEARDFDLANRERLLAADVRRMFGTALAATHKLENIEETLAAAKQAYELIAARVTEGKVAPLEQNMFLVEVNRLQSLRETTESKVETALFELRNIIGFLPEQTLRLRGDFSNLLSSQPSLSDATAAALLQRPDLQGARAVEQLAAAQIEKAKADGKLNAGLKSGISRNDMAFPVNGIDAAGNLRQIHGVFNSFTFGIEIDLPARNRNQGAIEAAVFEQSAAQRRVEFGELTIRREVASAIAGYFRAARSLSIFENGVRDQANDNLQVIRQTYELGARSLFDYIAEQRRFLEVENEFIDTQLEAYNAKVEIMQATSAPELTLK